jgi:UDP-N-acetylmuramate--alanine ligase
MGAKDYLVSSTLTGVIAQRLVRRLCPKCKEAYNPSIEEARLVVANPEEQAEFMKRTIYRPKGCFECNNEGYKGRLGCYEIMLINKEIKNYEKVTDGLDCKVITYGMDDSCDYYAVNVSYNDRACGQFDVMYRGEFLGHVCLSVTGEHNVSNALSTIAAARHLNIGFPQIQAGLAGFSGTNRRFQYKGTLNGVTIIDDYAHHPTEIRATLEAAKNYPHKDIWCVFQPHTYTRTKAFFKEFAEALSLADHVVLADIYAARETDTLGVSSELLSEEIKALGADCHYFPSFEEIQEFLKSHCIHGDLLITMGAGDVVNIGENLLSE